MVQLIDNALPICAVNNLLKTSSMEPEEALRLSNLGFNMNQELSTQTSPATPPSDTASTPKEALSTADGSMPSTPTRSGLPELLDPTLIHLDDPNWHSMTSGDDTNVSAATTAAATATTVSTPGISMSDYWPAAAVANNFEMTSAPMSTAVMTPTDVPLLMGLGPVDLSQYPRTLLPNVNGGFSADMTSMAVMASTPFIDPEKMLSTYTPTSSMLEAAGMCKLDKQVHEFNCGLDNPSSSHLVTAYPNYYDGSRFVELAEAPVLHELTDVSTMQANFDVNSVTNHAQLPVALDLVY
jgi:hypothetical protein